MTDIDDYPEFYVEAKHKDGTTLKFMVGERFIPIGPENIRSQIDTAKAGLFWQIADDLGLDVHR